MNTKLKLIGLLKKELFCLQKSPIFYILTAFYAVSLALRFFFANQFFSGNGSSDLRFFFSSVPYISILVLPLLTIIVSLKPFDTLTPLPSLLLFSIKLSSLFIAFAAMNLCILFVPLSVSFFGDVDTSQLILGFFGVLLYGLFALSLTLFISVLLKNTVAFLFASSIILAVFNSAHLFAVYTGITGRVASIMQLLSFSWHFDAAAKGIIDSRDIFFYLVWTLFFLCSSSFVFSLKNGERRYTRLFSFFALDCILLTLLSAHLSFRLDCSREKMFSVSPYSTKALSNADEVLRIKYYLSSELRRLYPQVRDVEDFLFQYCAKSQNAELSIINPDSKEGKEAISGYALTSQQLRSSGKNKTEYLNVYSAIVLEYLGNTEIIPFELSATTLEYDLTRAVEKIVLGIERKALIISGNALDIDSEYSYVRPWLEAAGVKTDVVLGSDLTNDALEALLKTNTPVVVFGSSSFTQESAAALSRFIDKGGKAFFAVSALDVDISSDWSVSERAEDFILPLLESKGIRIEKALVADISSSQIVMDSADDAGSSTRQDIFNYPLWVSIMPQQSAKEGCTLFWASPVHIAEDAAATPLLATTRAAWLLQPENEGEYLIDTNPFRVPKTAGKGEATAQYFLGAEKQNIIVISDQYFASSLMLSYINNGASPDFRNLDFLSAAVLHLQGADELSSLKHSATSSYALYKIADTDSFIFYMRLSLFLSIAAPLLIISLFAVLSALKRKSAHF